MICRSTGLELVLNAAEGVLQIIVSDDEELLCAQEWRTADRATEILAPALDHICRTLDVKPAHFRRLACVRGPGSFTGIRLTLATAAGLRRTGQARAAGLCYLQALAASAVLQRWLPYTASVWVLTHARRNLVHCQPFVSYGPRIPPQPAQAVDLCSPQEALGRITASLPPPGSAASGNGPVLVCGSGLGRNAPVFAALDGMGETAPAPDAPVLALPQLTSPAVAALRLLARHGDYADEDVAPLYVRPCDAVENLPQLAPRLGFSGDAAAAALGGLLERAPRSEI